MGRRHARPAASLGQSRTHGRSADVKATPAGSSATSGPPPIFVGGTGRSGTTIVARTLGTHRDYALIPVEAKFHSDPWGVPGFLGGRCSAEEVATRLSEGWHPGRGRTTGLTTVIDDYLLEGSLAKFVERAEGNAPDAARQLISELFVAYAQSEGKLGWVEMTPRNLASARPLYSLFPNMKLVDVMRDGRDVAASLVGLGWKRDPIDALKWWEGRIQQGYRSTRLLPATCHFVLQFEDLVNHRRHETLDSLFSFLGWSAPAEPLAFMEHHVTPDRAHVGRWQHDFDDDTQKRVTAEYQAALDRLGPAGVLLP